MKKELTGNMVFDASVIIEMLQGTDIGIQLKDFLINETILAHTSEISLAEARYVICRLHNKDIAEQKIANLLDSGFIKVFSILDTLTEAANYKCKYAISLPDCFVIALAKDFEMPALFHKKEKELMKIHKELSKEIELLFLEDFL